MLRRMTALLSGAWVPVLVLACGDERPPPLDNSMGEESMEEDTSETQSGGASGGRGGSPDDDGSGGDALQTGGATNSLGGAPGSGGETGENRTGKVDFVPYFEAGSAWTESEGARQMVDALLDQFEALMRTSGPWDATIEIYLTDDVASTAKTYFDAAPQRVDIDGKSMFVPSTWTEIVLGAEDANGPADDLGNGFDIGIDFNVAGHADNPGLLRHELMHGLGIVTLLDPPIMSETDDLSGLEPGSMTSASLYDTLLVDADGEPLLGNYNSVTRQFEVQPYAIQSTYDEWLDAETGVSFRGIDDDDMPLDMLISVFPDPGGARQDLNEPRDVMSAAVHPNWDFLEAPDRAALRALGYELAD